MDKVTSALQAARQYELPGGRPKWAGRLVVLGRLGPLGRIAGALLRVIAEPPTQAIGAALEREQQRWFLWLPVAFGLGIGLYFWLPGEPTLLAALAPVPAAVILAWVLPRFGLMRFVTGGLIALSAGMAMGKIRTEMVRGPVLEQQLRRVQITGWLELAEIKPKGGQRLTIHVVSLGALAAQHIPIKVRVTTRRVNKALIPGDLITLKATIGPPGRPALPGGYDFARHAWFQQLGGIGYGRQMAQRVETAAPTAAGATATTTTNVGTSTLVAPLSLRLSAAIQRLRQRLGRRITKALPGETGAIANALITGERAAISDATNEAFRDSGLFHILSISGLHMVIMAGAIFFLLRAILAAIPSIALRFSIKKWGAGAAAIGALAYLAISGGTFATVRSYIMISIMFLAILLDRPAVALRNVALAALVILVLYPESLLNVGFQMSFAAVVSLVAAYEALRERAATKPRHQQRGSVLTFLVFFGGIILTTLVASIAVAPFAAFHFHTSQQYAVLANLIAVPICNLIVMPAALATFIAMPFGAEALPLWVMGKGIEGMVWCAKAVAQLPGAVALLPQISKAAFLLMVAGGLWLTLWRTRWRLAGIVAMIAGVVLAPGKSQPDIFIGGDGELVAVRLAKNAHGVKRVKPLTSETGAKRANGQSGSARGAIGGALSALPIRRGGVYQLERWLRADGDGRKGDSAAKGAGFACDDAGCTARVKGVLISVPRHARAFRDDCARADIIVSRLKVPNWCGQLARVSSGSSGTSAAAEGATRARRARRALVIVDKQRLQKFGVHTIKVVHEAGGAMAASDSQSRTLGAQQSGAAGARTRLVVDWVAAHRGVRPWSPRRGERFRR